MLYSIEENEKRDFLLIGIWLVIYFILALNIFLSFFFVNSLNFIFFKLLFIYFFNLIFQDKDI